MPPTEPGRLVRFLERRPWTVALAALFLGLLALPVLLRLEIDNHLEVWLDHSSDAYREYEEFRDLFGSEEFVLVIYPLPEGAAGIDHDWLFQLTDLRFELEAIDGVERVEDLAAVFARLFGPRGLEAFRRDVSDSPFYEGFLVSPDRRLAATWIDLDLEHPEERGAVVAAIEEAVARVPPGDPVHLAGSPVLNVALDRTSRQAAQTFFPWVFVLSAVLLLVFFRRPGGVLVPFVAVGTGIAWTLAAFELAGGSLDMITVALPPLVWVLGLSTSIHLLLRRRHWRERGVGAEDATRLALDELLRPCFLSAATTAVGFASLAASSMEPVRRLGIFAALGVLFCFVANFLLFPAFARWLGRREAEAEHVPPVARLHPILDAVVGLLDRPRRVLAVAGVGAVVLVAGIVRLDAEANPIEFFRDEAAISVVYKEVLPGFTGAYSLEVLVEPPVDVSRREALGRLKGFRDRIEARDDVARVLSVLDLVLRAHQENQGGAIEAYRFPADEAAFEAAWERLAVFPEELSSFSREGQLRFSIIARPMGSGAHRELVQAVEDALYNGLDDGLEDPAEAGWGWRVTGIVRLLVELQDELVASQVRTFGLAFLMIGVVLAIVLRRPAHAALSLGPNLLPVTIALGLMGWLGVALDPATVMIAGIALGIAVDDTIHYLVAYRGERDAGRTPREAATAAIYLVGRPMIVTSVVAALGFLVLCFSGFVPLGHFGALTAVALGAALLGDLVVLPAELLVIRRRDPRRDPAARPGG